MDKVSIRKPLSGSNSVQLRHYNERVVLDVIRQRQSASKAEIARAANLTPPAVAAIVDSLEQAKLLQQNGKKQGLRGQPSIMYQLDPDGAFSIGVHIGRRSLDIVLSDFAGSVRAERTLEYDYPAPPAIREFTTTVVLEFLSGLGRKKQRIVGIGIASPYFLSGWTDELQFPAAISAQWQGLDLTTLFAHPAINLPLFVENDASSAALAELVLGIGSTIQNFIHISINTLIGGGLVLDGALHTGPNANTAAYGPFPVTHSRLSTAIKPDAPFEILLRRASIYVLMRHLRMNDVKINRARDVATLEDRAQGLYQEWRDDCAEALAQAVIGSASVVDVDAVVIDSILPAEQLRELVKLTEQYFDMFMPAGVIKPQFVTGSLGAWQFARGASILPLYSLFFPLREVLTKTAVEKKSAMVGAF